MRKIFATLSALTLTVFSSLPLIACNNQFNDPNIYRITVVTDGHTIDDHSFNESSYKAAQQFQREFDVWSHSEAAQGDVFANKKVAISWDNPQLTTLDSLKSSYHKAAFINSKVIIASGFLHHDALVNVQNTTLKNVNDLKFIFVDGDTTTKEVPKNKKLAGLLYKAEQSGFLAGLAGAIWLTAHADEFGGLNNLKMSTYGGMDIPAVTNYMYGYYWAVKLFNDEALAGSDFHQQLLAWVKVLNPHFNAPLPTIAFTLIKNNNQFSGDFLQGSNGSKGINETLVGLGTNIIFPVAGPQTEDTISAFKNSNGKIIGVDTNQQEQYPQAVNRFLTSAQKDIVNSVKYMLWRSVGRSDQPNHDIDPQAANYFRDNAVPQGGEGFTGIANNDAISAIYDALKNLNEADNKYHELLNKVSTGWSQVLALGSDYWANGIKTEHNPFK